MTALQTFPPVNSGGLIEAPAPAPESAPEEPAFPPVNSGGLIEALDLSALRKATACGFRR